MLTNSSSLNYLTWQQSKDNAPFVDSFQIGTNLYPKAFYTSSVNNIYLASDTLPMLTGISIDLRNLYDLINTNITFTDVYSIQISSEGGNLEIGPDVVDPVYWFWGDPSNKIVIKDGSSFLYANKKTPFPVDSDNKNIYLYNPSSTVDLVYKIAILGYATEFGVGCNILVDSEHRLMANGSDGFVWSSCS